MNDDSPLMNMLEWMGEHMIVSAVLLTIVGCFILASCNPDNPDEPPGTNWEKVRRDRINEEQAAERRFQELMEKSKDEEYLRRRQR